MMAIPFLALFPSKKPRRTRIEYERLRDIAAVTDLGRHSDREGAGAG
jgi:hypothetical protein